MAWRQCIVNGCGKRKPIQPFGTNTIHAWLCPKHRKIAQERRVAQLMLLANTRQSLAKIMTLRESSD